MIRAGIRRASDGLLLSKVVISAARCHTALGAVTEAKRYIGQSDRFKFNFIKMTVWTDLLLFPFIRLLLDALQLLSKSMSQDNTAPLPLPLLSSTSPSAVDASALHTTGHTHSFEVSGGHGTYANTNTNNSSNSSNIMTVKRVGTHTHLRACEVEVEVNLDCATALVDTFCEYAVRTCGA